MNLRKVLYALSNYILPLNQTISLYILYFLNVNYTFKNEKLYFLNQFILAVKALILLS